MKAPSEPIAKQKRWADTRGIQTIQALYHTQASHSTPEATNAEQLEEQGDFQSKEDKDYRVSSEKDKFRVSWNVERRCFLNQISNNA